MSQSESQSNFDPNSNERVRSDRWVMELYDELHRLASGYLRDEPATVSLSPTVMIHELFLRLPKAEELSRTHFFALASTTMRRVLVDQARSRNRLKRGGKLVRREFADWDLVCISDPEQVLAVDEALQDLALLDTRQAQVVEMKFFGGMSVEEIAEQLKLSKRTIEADWTMAKAWLRRWFADESSIS